MKVTILTCTYNGKNKLSNTLKAFTALIIPAEVRLLEILIVDNNSDDGTSDFVLDYWKTLDTTLEIIVVNEKKAGKSNALITGFNRAQGDIIILCDDDNWLDESYIVQTIEVFKDPDIGLAGGFGRKAVFTDDRQPVWFNQFMCRYMVGTHHKKSRYLVKNDYSIYGAGSVIRKSVWDLVYQSGFRFQNFTNSNKAMAEDSELAMAVAFSGNKLYFDDELTFVHDLRWGRLSIENLKQQEKLNGKCSIYPMVYELIYHRIGSSYLFLRFLKHYLHTFFEVRQQLQKLRIARSQAEDIVTEVDFTKVRSTYRNMVLMLPIVIYKYPKIKCWIQYLVEHSKAQ